MQTKTSPLTFELESDVYAKLEQFRTETNTRSVSVIIRKALEDFDFDSVHPENNTARQMSVRLPKDLRDELKQASKSNGVSLGKIVREAILTFFENHKNGNY